MSTLRVVEEAIRLRSEGLLNSFGSACSAKL